MLKQLIFLFISVLGTAFLQGQTAPGIIWQESFGGSEFEILYDMKGTPDGGCILAGQKPGTGTANRIGSCSVERLNIDGNVQWEKFFNGPYGFGAVAYTITQTPDNGCVVAGSCYNTDAQGSDDFNTDLWVIKLDSTGTVQWEKTMGHQYRDYARSVRQTKDGGYIIAGVGIDSFKTLPAPPYYVFDNDYYVIRLDSLGNIIWQKMLGGSSFDVANSIIPTGDDGFIVIGKSVSVDRDVLTDNSAGGYWVVKLNASGNIQWQKNIGTGPVYDGLIESTIDGGYIIGGGLPGNIDWNYYVAKITASGDVEWQKTYGGTKDDAINSIKQTPDGGYILAGFTSSTDGDITGNHGDRDYWVVKINSTGEMNWQKALGGTGYDYACAISQTPGGYWVAGYSRSVNGDITNNHGGYDYWLVKLGGGTVPVKIVSLSATPKDKNIIIQWQAATDPGTQTFEIQRSNNGVEFITIGQVAAGAAINDYAFTDNTPSEGINYYRLKQNDKTGEVTYSVIVKVVISGNKLSQVYPNPVRSVVSIIPAQQLKSIEIIAADGRLVRKLLPSVNDQYELGGLASGIYLLKLLYKNTHEYIQLVKQ